MIFIIKIQNGRMIIPPILKKYLENKNGKFLLSISPYKRKRTERQNAYYWGVIVPIVADFIKEDYEATHEILKERFNKKTTEKGRTYIASTSSLNTQEFSEYIDRIIRKMAEFNIVIPPPYEEE